MRKILVVSHGHLATGVKSNAEIILGENENVCYIDGYIDGLSPKEDIETYIASLGENEEVIVFTDILAGSVTKLVAPYIPKGNIYVVAGFNMPMILEAISSIDSNDSTDVFVQELIKIGQSSINYVNKELNL